ncbi:MULTISPECIES: hypothetical protein [unclassified Nonomuraea]|uniref:hypothetical protein n=1 Tax=unclassified Nonomuraea TaxID=2593643 RepID=UPI0033C483B9
MIRNLATAAAALALTTTGFLTMSTGIAHAAPVNCWADEHYGSSGEYAHAGCGSGTGHVRAVAYCTDNPSTGYGAYYYGNWARVPTETSKAPCPSNRRYLVDAGYEPANW